MKVNLNCCSKPALYNTTLFKGEKAEVKAPAVKTAELSKDTVEISKKPVEAKADSKVEVKTDVKSEAAKATKPAEIKPVVAEAKKDAPAVKCEGDACKKEVPTAKCEGDACKK